jgi:hypothetical protein
MKKNLFLLLIPLLAACAGDQEHHSHKGYPHHIQEPPADDRPVFRPGEGPAENEIDIYIEEQTADTADVSGLFPFSGHSQKELARVLKQLYPCVASL